MPYKNRIRIVSETHRVLEEQIMKFKEDPEHDKDRLQEMLMQKSSISQELSRLNRLQWEEDHERVDFGDDR